MLGFLEDRFGIGFRTVGVRDRQLVEGLNRKPIQIWRFDLFDSGADSLFSVPVFDREGILRRIIRRAETPRRVTRSDFDQWVKQTIEIRDPPPEERAEMRRTAGELSVAETMPAFRWIVVDSEDNLWVEEWEGVGWD
jgi:hypothetical protein